MYASYSKLPKELKYGIDILEGHAFLSYGSEQSNVVWINNSRTTWPT